MQQSPSDVGHPIFTYDYAVTEKWKIFYAMLSFMSLIFSLVIPVVYLVSKKTRHHPAIILVLICVFEMISCYHLMIWAMDLKNFLYFFHVQELLQLWDFGNSSLSEFTFCQMNLSMYFLALFLQFSYYIVLCLDLVITLKRPFISGKQRLMWYHLGVIFNSVLSFIFIYPRIQESCTQVNDSPILFIAFPPVIVVQMIFYLFGIISIILAVRTQYRHSITDKELYQAKTQYLKNHILLISMLFGIWSVPFTCNVILLLNKKKKYELLNSISFCIILSQGIFLGMIRLNEKFFRNRVILMLKSLFGKATLDELEMMQRQESMDIADEDTWNFSLATLAGQAQNQEVVSHILQGVLSITQYQKHDARRLNKSENTFPSIDIVRKWCQEDKTKIFKANDQVKFVERSTFDDVIDQYQEKLRENLLDDPLIKGSLQFEGSDFEKVKVTEYSPRVFQIIRNQDNILPDVFQRSLCLQSNVAQIKKAQQSLGKSGSFFFFSHDNRLILKTMTNTELDVLKKKFLKNYVFHIIKHPKSLLAKVYGAYTVSIATVAPINLILMENTLGPLSLLGGASCLYDLKGSLINRQVRPKLESTSPVVYKDQNYLDSDDIFLQLLADDRQELLDQLKSDTDFLRDIKIMDYSLLMGIAKNDDSVRFQTFEKSYSRRSIIDVNGNIVSLALIDYLQQFDFGKQLEYRYKTIIKQNSKDLISCVLPNQYQARFLNFIKQIICAVIYEDQ